MTALLAFLLTLAAVLALCTLAAGWLLGYAAGIRRRDRLAIVLEEVAAELRADREARP